MRRQLDENSVDSRYQRCNLIPKAFFPFSSLPTLVSPKTSLTTKNCWFLRSSPWEPGFILQLTSNTFSESHSNKPAILEIYVRTYVHTYIRFQRFFNLPEKTIIVCLRYVFPCRIIISDIRKNLKNWKESWILVRFETISNEWYERFLRVCWNDKARSVTSYVYPY